MKYILIAAMLVAAPSLSANKPTTAPVAKPKAYASANDVAYRIFEILATVSADLAKCKTVEEIADLEPTVKSNVGELALLAKEIKKFPKPTDEEIKQYANRIYPMFKKVKGDMGIVRGDEQIRRESRKLMRILTNSDLFKGTMNDYYPDKQMKKHIKAAAAAEGKE